MLKMKSTIEEIAQWGKEVSLKEIAAAINLFENNEAESKCPFKDTTKVNENEILLRRI